MNNDKIEILNGLNARYEALLEQLKIVEQQISELALLEQELEIIQNNENHEIMTSIGKSVFVPVTIKNGKLLVDVGAGYFVRKDINEVKAVIKEQKQRLGSFQIQLSSDIDNIAKELQSLIV